MLPLGAFSADDDRLEEGAYGKINMENKGVILGGVKSYVSLSKGHFGGKVSMIRK